MMRLFRKNAAGGSRRHAKLNAQRIRKMCGIGFCVSALLGLTVYGFTSGAFEKAAHWTRSQTLSATSAAGFRIENILVSGRTHTTAEALLSHLEMSAGDPIFGVSLPKAQEAIAQEPWIDTVSVARRLPDTIVVTVTERTPAALWQHKKKLSLIDGTGRVLTAENLEVWRHLPLVVGDTAHNHVTEILKLLHAEPDIAQNLAAAVRIGTRRWDLQMKNGTLVRLPEQDVEFALRRLALMQQEEGLLDMGVRQIDLRVAGKLAVTPPETAEKKDAAPDRI